MSLRAAAILLYSIFAAILPVFGITDSPISYSTIPILENLENAPPKKYSERHILKINEVLEKRDQKIRVVTYNILFDLFDHRLKDKTYSWPERLPHIIQSIKNMQPDILGFQETYPAQVQDLRQSLEGDYACFVGDSTIGELNAIFYNKNRFELSLANDQNGSADLSSASLTLPLHPADNPIVKQIPGFLPPDIEPGRRLTLAHLHDKLTDKHFVVMNTHLPFFRINSREEQAYFIADLVVRLHAQDIPVVLTGDFNTFPNRPEKLDLPFFDGSHICQIFQVVLNDTKQVALLGHVGPHSTGIPDFLTRENQPLLGTENPAVILDHIFVSPSISVIINATETTLINGRFPSDHLPVIADILLP